jgi:hypothetical protein
MTGERMWVSVEVLDGFIKREDSADCLLVEISEGSDAEAEGAIDGEVPSEMLKPTSCAAPGCTVVTDVPGSPSLLC